MYVFIGPAFRRLLKPIECPECQFILIESQIEVMFFRFKFILLNCDSLLLGVLNVDIIKCHNSFVRQCFLPILLRHVALSIVDVTDSKSFCEFIDFFFALAILLTS